MVCILILTVNLAFPTRDNFSEGRQILSDQEEFNKEEKRVLDLLTRVCRASFRTHSAWDVLTLRSSEASLSASCDSQRSTNGWITSAPAARAIKNSPSCVRKPRANGVARRLGLPWLRF